MADIYDLPNKDIAKMTEDELRAHILAIRSRRRAPDPEMKASAKKKAISKKNKTVEIQSVSSMLKGITPEQAKEILEQLNKDKA